MWTLKIKVMPDSWSVWLKISNSGIYFSEFPKMHARVAICQKVLIRISWYVPHFEGFWVTSNMQFEFWMDTDRSEGSCLLCSSLYSPLHLSVPPKRRFARPKAVRRIGKSKNGRRLRGRPREREVRKEKEATAAVLKPLAAGGWQCW